MVNNILLALSGFAALAVAAPAPQNLNFDLINAAPDVTSAPPYKPGQTADKVTYNPSAAIASAKAEATVDPLAQAAKQKRDSCSAYPVDTSSADNFRNDAVISATANGANTPPQYNQEFVNLKGATGTYGYMGFEQLTSYDPAYCASSCNNKAGCLSFNIYWEMDPPASGCTNPNVVIKCSYWGAPIDSTTATNTGGWYGSFEIAIAGSNGYTSTNVQTVPGYTGPTYLGTSAINAPLDCNGKDTFMGSRIFTSGAFDPNLCAAACDSQSAYNIAHPPSSGSPQICTFFNTFITSENNVPQGQYCSLYTEPWSAGYATNNGQTRGSDVYTISYSFSFVNSTNAGYPTCEPINPS